MLENLNEEQLEAVKITEGPLLVLAGAGSGKTKVLTTRIAYLIKEKKIEPYHILAITFTNKAAKEMKDRIINILGSVGYEMQISTFHSLGVRFIRENYEKLGYQSNFTILDSDDSLTIIKKIMKEMNLDPKIYNPRAIRNSISGAKNELIVPEEYSRFVGNDFEEKVLEIYKRYENKLMINNSVDFDDLLMKPIVLFKKYPEVLQRYQEKFQYILIDEYQDTNEAQYILSKMLSAKYRNICVVGDNDQSIYSFRGSNYKNILNFEKDYKEAKIIMLEKNYRSTKNILSVANDIIKNNKKRKEKSLWTDNGEGSRIHYHRSENEKDEAFYVVNEIKRLINNGVKKEEIAILYRTNAQSRAIEDILLRDNIPYKVVGSYYFYNRKEIKDLISYLKLIYNSNDDTSLIRIINVPKRGIGLKTIENLGIKASEQNSSIYGIIDSGKELLFKNIIEEIKLEMENLSLTELIELVLTKTGMKQELINEKSLEADIRLENLEEFKTITRYFEEMSGTNSLEDFLSEISLVSDIEEHKNNKEVVTLMTVHSAKGLEFEKVFVVGLEEGIFPHRNSFSNNEDLEEERRLCYVAVTRGKNELWLVNARRRMIFGDINQNPPSRFIEEINKDYLEIEDIKEPTAFHKEDLIDDTIEYNVGDKVIHELYGQGIVISFEETRHGTLLVTAFPHPYEIKKLMKGHKSFRKV